MILIVDEYRRKTARCLRESLWNCGIPSVLTDRDHIERFPEALCAIAFVGSEEYLNTVSLRCHRIPLLAINESQSRIYNKDVLFYDPSLNDSYTDFLLSFLKEKYGFLPDEFGTGDVLLKGDDVLVGYAYLRFTKTERRILALLVMCSGKWVSSDTVRNACFENTGKGETSRISVHICNINKKSSAVCGRNLIRTKRGIGYMLDRGI